MKEKEVVMDELQMEVAKRLAVALDGMNYDQALAMIQVLAPLGVVFKVGLEVITLPNAAVDRLIEEVYQLGGSVFYDIKLHDIPPTVKNASKNIAAKHVRFFNMHVSASIAAIKAAVEGVNEYSADRDTLEERPLILGVTILTSLDLEDLRKIGFNVPGSRNEEASEDEKREVQRIVCGLAKMAKDSGLDGVVCSALEVEAIREACGEEFVIMVPGIRFPDAKNDDQKRKMGPREAIEKGASILVVGRPDNKGR